MILNTVLLSSFDSSEFIKIATSLNHGLLCPMKKNHLIFIRFLYNSIRKLYDYCIFSNKNNRTTFFDVLKTYDFCMIKILIYKKRVIFV